MTAQAHICFPKAVHHLRKTEYSRRETKNWRHLYKNLIRKEEGSYKSRRMESGKKLPNRTTYTIMSALMYNTCTMTGLKSLQLTEGLLLFLLLRFFADGNCRFYPIKKNINIKRSVGPLDGRFVTLKWSPPVWIERSPSSCRFVSCLLRTLWGGWKELPTL